MFIHRGFVSTLRGTVRAVFLYVAHTHPLAGEHDLKSDPHNTTGENNYVPRSNPEVERNREIT